MAKCNGFHDDLEELVSCGVCNDVLNIPKTLSCLHTFCLKCIENWQRQCNREKKPFNCPTCRIPIRVDADDVSRLPTSFHHNSLIELLKINEEKKEHDDDQLFMTCSSCSNHRVVAGSCFQCDAMLCDECYVQTQNTKTTEKKTEFERQTLCINTIPIHAQQALDQQNPLFLPNGSHNYVPPPRPLFRPQRQQARPRWRIGQRQVRPAFFSSRTGHVPRFRGLHPVVPHHQRGTQQSQRQGKAYTAGPINQVTGMPDSFFVRQQLNLTHSNQIHPAYNEEIIPQGSMVTIVEPFTPTAYMVTTKEAKQMIGEHLYQIIQQKYPELAGKITGMLLENDNDELLSLLESHEALNAKVEEAINVLKAHQAKEARIWAQEKQK